MKNLVDSAFDKVLYLALGKGLLLIRSGITNIDGEARI